MIRVKNRAFHLYHQRGEKILLSEWLETVGKKAVEITVSIKDSQKT